MQPGAPVSQSERHDSTVNHHTAMTTTLECDTAIGDAVLQAARAALPADAASRFQLPDDAQLATKQQPLIPLLIALIEATQRTASAIGDNAWDDSLPLPKLLASELARQCRAIADDLDNATQCPDRRVWSLPSMSGKELV